MQFVKSLKRWEELKKYLSKNIALELSANTSEDIFNNIYDPATVRLIKTAQQSLIDACHQQGFDVVQDPENNTLHICKMRYEMPRQRSGLPLQQNNLKTEQKPSPGDLAGNF
jgi:hypothetical protein